MEKRLRIRKKLNEKPKFYVFSGIERTLVSKDFYDRYYGRSGFFHGEAAPDPECIKALNYLISSLEEKFDVRLVITSQKREDKTLCEHYLKMYGLEYNKPMFFTKYVSGPRGEKVVDFLESQGAGPLTFHTAPLYVRFLKNFKDNPDFKNYVVIEGGKKQLSKYIPASQIKKVSPKTGLTKKDVDQVLEAHGISPVVEMN